jgi:hypothetical protein
MCAYGPVTAGAAELQYPAQGKCCENKDCIRSNAEGKRKIALASFLGGCMLILGRSTACNDCRQAQNFLSHTSHIAAVLCKEIHHTEGFS